MPEENKTPTTVRELGIKLAGFEELVNERFKNLTDSIERLASALETSNSQKADQKDLDDLIARVVFLENKKPWVLVLCTVLLTAILTFFLQLEISRLLGGGK